MVNFTMKSRVRLKFGLVLSVQGRHGLSCLS